MVVCRSKPKIVLIEGRGGIAKQVDWLLIRKRVEKNEYLEGGGLSPNAVKLDKEPNKL